MRYKVKSLNVGRIETLTYGKRTFESAIRKQSVSEPIFLSKTGLKSDEQAYEYHGGEDKALCLYSYDYYPYWKNVVHHFSETALFGENLTVEGLKEDNAHIGDIFSFGEAIIQVSEPRNPCYKLAEKYEVPDMVVRMRDTGYTGFLFRVLKEGVVSVNDDLVLLEPDAQKVSVASVNEVKFFDRFNKEKLEKVLAVKALSESIRVPLLKQYQSDKTNEWS
ncbi:MOSC domain-containing protein [Robertmurraya kyonggiensis]|uniref:MOSC domain-containing protein n=1 Tax=Robertmurraya kyonggiensis TaxID=1037680 RepID=A0A4U1D8Q4_9BACI|nr:MOSC domain-containing protein [Robertmurraya kyonggiensis]TKC18861.1 MOSC domain-containing protein [Robertmurraya kyonggiensis]